jgi:HAD superfamily hydrolase (TIGR01549 family)
MLEQSWYSEPVRVPAVCVFDLDHTLVDSPLDLHRVAREMEAFARHSGVLLPEREHPWYGAEILAAVREQVPHLEAELMQIPIALERAAMPEAKLVPFAKETLSFLKEAGCATAIWTNNDAIVAEFVLSRFELKSLLDLVITRDQVARLKPDGDGLRLVKERWPSVKRVVVIGDSWIDAAGALAESVPFIGYRVNEADLQLHGTPMFANLQSLADLAETLVHLFGEDIFR